MTLFLLAFLAGVLTIASPCILPVLPFVLTRGGQPFRRSGLPMLIGMALAFAAVASLAAVAGSWAIELNRYGRGVALALVALFGLALLFPALSERLTAPLVKWGNRLNQSAERKGASFGSSALLGVATGLLWAPCAGPVLGLILSGAALSGPSLQTTLLLLAYAAGAATSLGAALLVGGRLFGLMKRSLRMGNGLRRGAGAAVLASVMAISLGLDTGALTQISSTGVTATEQTLIDLFRPLNVENNHMTDLVSSARADAPAAPPLFGTAEWINSAPLTTEDVKGKVVLVNFWTYSCINCLRSLPYVRAWSEKYADQGLVVIGVHAPEFAFEKDADNVRTAAAMLGVTYPVVIDNDYAIWRTFRNQAWPAFYVLDANGFTRHSAYGEGDFAETEKVIQTLLAEAGSKVGSEMASIRAGGAQIAPDLADLRSPETYIGYDHASSFASPGGVREDVPTSYDPATMLDLNEWGLSGNWTVGGEYASLNQAGGRIVHRFHARDLHLVMGPSPDGKPTRFRVTIDGVAPGSAHGTDIDPTGLGTVTSERLYQLVRQSGAVTDHIFEIEFLDPGVRAYAFTFG